MNTASDVSFSGGAVSIDLVKSIRGAARADIRTLDTFDPDNPRRVVWITIDETDRRGALSADACLVIETAATVACDKRFPLVMSLGSSGADIVEGIAALHGWGSAAKALARCSGIVPTIHVVTGPAVSGPALLIGLADFVIMTDNAYAFVSGPTMVSEFTGELVSNDELGGAIVHGRASGVASMVVPTVEAAHLAVEQILHYLPNHVDEIPNTVETDDPFDRQTPEAGDIIPATSTGSYDVRKVVSALVDNGEHLELRAKWAANVVTTFARIDGRVVGIVANQPMVLAGTLDIPASQKAARFVAFCDAFNIPIITLVDTPGFYPGKDLEWRGMIRHGAQLVFAYARASVPRVCIILRKSYGGAYIVMDSKNMGNDLCLAWPWAELAVMGAGQAAAILQRRATPEERAEFEADYAHRLLNPYVAAERGLVDGVIEPSDTRREIASALRVLADKRENIQARKHDNTPL